MNVSPAPDPREGTWRERLRGGPLSPAEAREFATFALDKVSRTFALNIRALPEPLRDQVLHAYLYCRMADTVEDDDALPRAEKSTMVRCFGALFDPVLEPFVVVDMAKAYVALLPESWRADAARTDAAWEKILLMRAPDLISAFTGYPPEAQAAIAGCVREMCAGMAEFALREPGRAVKTVEELDRYCWYVAGTVGVMLCGLFIGRGGIPAARAARMRALCASFGTGLQMVNILQDVGDDDARGVSWLPAGVPRAALVAKAAGHLREALEYTLAIPRRHRGLRLFCLWPLLMAAETLAVIAEKEGTGDARDGSTRPKIARARVARIVARTGLLWWSDAWLRAEFAASEGRIARALHEPPAPHTFGAP